MTTIVLSLGGSVLIPSLESNELAGYAAVLAGLAERHRCFVVVGGGGEARRFIGVGRDLGIDEATLDEIGILVTRLNARLLVAALGDAAYPGVPETYAAAKACGVAGRVVVMGGVAPGQTTDAVAAVLAEEVGADLLINATSVPGVFTADPKKDPAAVRHGTMTPGELLALVAGERMGAGSNTVIDLVAAKIVERSGIPMVVLDGRRPETVRDAILTGVFEGTVIAKAACRPLPL
ncbi:MAG: UMP kinase [Methanospirillum sp.]|nr:UMP kinase [Methanospirillum sp.]